MSAETAMTTTLREYFVWIKLAGGKTADGYWFRSNESAADAAVAVVAQWLRDEAAVLTKMADQEEIPTVRTLLLVKADALQNRAAEIEERR